MAILPEAARAWAEQQGSAEALQRAVAEHLLAPDPPPVGYGRGEEYPEDVVVALLEDEGLADSARQAVVDGWDEACKEVGALLYSPLDEARREELRRPFTRVFRVPALTGHPALGRRVRSALLPALGEDSLLTARQIQQVVMAAMAYPDRVARGTWHDALRQRPEVAAYAFRMLLDLDKDRPDQIAEHFLELLRKQFVEHEDLDCGFLAASVPRALGTDKPLRKALSAFRHKYPDQCAGLRADLRANPCWPRVVATAPFDSKPIEPDRQGPGGRDGLPSRRQHWEPNSRAGGPSKTPDRAGRTEGYEPNERLTNRPLGPQQGDPFDERLWWDKVA